MADNTVKVTLSADDQATEIVRRLSSAVKQLDAQTRAAASGTRLHGDAAKSAVAGFDGLSRAISGVVIALGELKVLESLRDLIQSTDELGHLAEKTGASTEALSALSVAADRLNISSETVGTGLKFLARSSSELAAGNAEAAASFQAIGLSAKDLKGLSLDQVFVKVANAQANFADGAGKTAVALKLFGRSGEEMIPLLNELAHGGFDEARKSAEAMGVSLDTDATQAAKNFDRQMADLKNTVKGFALQFTQSVIGPITDLVDVVAKFGQKVPSELKAFAAGAFIAASAGVALTGAFIALSAAAVVADIALLPILGTIALIAAAVGGVVAIAVAIHNLAKANDELTDSAKRAKGTGTDTKPPVVPIDLSVVKANRDARLAATKQAAKDELAADELGLKGREQAEAASFAQGLTSLAQFYKARAVIIEQGTAAQIAELEKERAAIGQARPTTKAEEIKQTTDLANIQAQIDRAKIGSQQQLLQLLEDERQARLRIADQVRGFEEQILRAQGNEAAAAQLEIIATLNQFTLALKAQGTHTAEEVQAEVTQLGKLLTARANFAAAEKRSQQEIADLDLVRSAIQLKITQGIISEHQGQLDIAEVERQRLPTLINLANQMDEFAAKSTDPALRQAAEQFRASFAGIGTVVQESTKLIANLGDSIRNAGKEAVSGFLTTGVNSFLTRDTTQLNALKAQLKGAQDEMAKLLAGPPSQAAGDRITQLRSEIAGLQAQVQDAKDSLPTIANAVRDAFAAAAQSIQKAIADILAAKFVEKISSLFDTPASTTAASQTTTAATALSTAGGIVVSAASDMQGAAGELSAAGAIVAGAAGAISLAAGALAAASASATASGLADLFGSNPFGLAFATGGPVRGPGTGTSDSILARLSAGEYVIRADAVKRLGLDFLNALNFGGRMPQFRRPSLSGLPAFAMGGLVTAGESSGGGTVSGGIEATFGLEEGLVLRHLASRGGVKMLRTIMSSNPQAFKADLGIE